MSDDERTHLILDAVPEEDSEAEQPLPTSRPPPSGEVPAHAASYDPERTHLILDPADVAEEDALADPGSSAGVAATLPAPPGSPASSRPPPTAGQPSSPPPAPVEPARGVAPAGDEHPARDERTRLMLGPVVVKDKPISVPPASTPGRGLGKRLERLGVAIDALMHARWALALLVAAIVCGLLAPLTGDTGGASGQLPSLLPSFAFFIGLAAFGLSWLTRLPSDDEVSKFSAALTRLQGALRLLVSDAEALRGAPRHLRLFSAGQLLALLGFTGLSVSSGVALLNAGDGPSWFAFGSGLLLLVGVSAAQFARRASVVPPAPDELGESVSAARHLAALTDLSDSLPPSFIDGHTSLHRILIALSQWSGDSWPDEASYLDALERHFRRHLPTSQVERDKWLGRTRRDGVAALVLDDMVAIEVARHFTPAAAARALARVGELAPKWSGKPILLLIFEAPREAMFQSAATSSLVNLHDEFPLLAVRVAERGGTSGAPASSDTVG